MMNTFCPNKQKGIVVDSNGWCDLCGRYDLEHDPACPCVQGDERKFVIWRCGYEDGLARKGYWSSDPTYRLGNRWGEAYSVLKRNKNTSSA